MRAIALCSVVAVLFYTVHARYHWSDVPSVALEGEELRDIAHQIHHLRPSLPHGSRVLFLDDPLKNEWRMMFLMRLSYHDNDLVVDRARFMPSPPTAQQIASYDYVFDYVHGMFFTSPQPRATGPEPVIAYEWGHPTVFHADWSPVNAKHPARRGEHLITKALDLGETDPPVAKGQPFPQDPFAQVRAAVNVTVDGRPAEVVNKIGWPQEADSYRLDFVVPVDVAPGQRGVQVRCGTAIGPAMPIDIR